MKVIIAGSRELTDYEFAKKTIDMAISELAISVTEVVSGGARGADKMGEDWAAENGIEVTPFRADWDNIDSPTAIVKTRTNPWTKEQEKYNANAGFERNTKMAEYADVLIALNEGTAGTDHMIKQAREKGLKVYVYQPKDEDYEYTL